MTVTTELIANPLKFLKGIFLTLASSLDYPTGTMVKPNGTVTVKLHDMAPDLQGMITVARMRNRKGMASLMPKTNKSWWEKTINYYQVRPANPGDPEPFEAYICPYKDNETNTKFLDMSADFMFTGDMNGCTFGVGIPNVNGGVLVGHANAANYALPTPHVTGTWEERVAPQRDAQRERLARRGLEQMIDPDVYRPADGEADLKAIAIGVRRGSDWSFWYQHQLYDPVLSNQYTMMSLTPLR